MLSIVLCVRLWDTAVPACSDHSDTSTPLGVLSTTRNDDCRCRSSLLFVFKQILCQWSGMMMMILRSRKWTVLSEWTKLPCYDHVDYYKSYLCVSECPVIVWIQCGCQLAKTLWLECYLIASGGSRLDIRNDLEFFHMQFSLLIFRWTVDHVTLNGFSVAHVHSCDWAFLPIEYYYFHNDDNFWITC